MKETDIRGEPDWEVIPGKTIQYKGKYITTVNLIKYYMSELIEIDGVVREIMTWNRQVVSNTWKVWVHDKTPEGIAEAILSGRHDYLSYTNESEAIEAGERIIDLNP